MKWNVLIASAIVFVFASPWASAQLVYRCTDAAGKVQLSDKACGKDAVDGSRVLLRPNTLDTSGAREQQLREENARLREQMQQQRQGSGAQTTGRTEADLQADRSSSYECKQAQRGLEVAASSITAPNGEARRAAEQRMRAACGMREPTQINVYNEAPRVPVRPRPARQQPLPFVEGNYNPAAGGYTDTRGNFCTSVAGGLQCPNGFVPVN